MLTIGGCQQGGVRDDGDVADIKRGRAARNVKLATIPVGFAGRAALGLGKRLTGKSKDEVTAELMEKAANQLFTVLGELKGGAMKVGQALSVMEAAIPEEFGEPYREALTKLQKDAPPLPAAKVHRVLDGQLGTKWRDRFTSFDDTPVASASIGQVHKGVWSDGREVAVKIQYPGADEALRADLKTMQRLVSVFKQLAPGADVQGVVDELIERTEMELDYRLEADNQRAFAKAYDGHPHFVIPHVVASAPKVMITEWIDGVPMSHIIRDGTVDERDLCGTRLIELTFDAPARLGMMHGDAHPGNFMMLPDGRMGVIDFGAVGPLPDGLPIEIGQIIRLARDKDYDRLLPTMEKVGFIQKGEQVSAHEIDDMLRQYVEPIEVEVFHYTRRWLQKMAAANMNVSSEQIKTARAMDLPAKLAIPLRVIASTVAISCQLDAHVPTQALAARLVPGFVEAEPVH
ncbi:AarF/ABC1/UbiB kinase family protein [Mycobacterium sp. shizuoka-1]|uniref:macrolide-binding ATPase MABP-1 n=1 Tax=Mycobacterium sp. shizuoka-1 TaxID=2039281 RepID=UPI000C067557|nr:AarF/ABC1/UbiB kinase family protein [Mycobacterium sp. shizuoka-1]GAY17986.1 ABC transporter ATP-binding protein [Mycobacterium sp. shizuoka-1]